MPIPAPAFSLLTVVETYVSYLRKKLHHDGFEGIRTVRGVGFQLLLEKK